MKVSLWKDLQLSNNSKNSKSGTVVFSDSLNVEFERK